MSIIINWSDFNTASGATVTKHRLYRSDVSREDCAQSQIPLEQFDVGTNTYHDNAVDENKLYWYRIETDTEYGLSKSEVRCMMWSNNIGEATGLLVKGDWESGFTTCKKDTRIEFRDFINHQVVSLLRKYGAIFNDNFGRLAPYMHGAIIVRGELLFVPSQLSNFNTITNDDATSMVNSVLRDPRRFFTFEGRQYCLDVMKPSEALIYAQMPGVPRTEENIPFEHVNYEHQDNGQVLLETSAQTEQEDGTYGLLTISKSVYNQTDTSETGLYGVDHLPFVARLIR